MIEKMEEGSHSSDMKTTEEGNDKPDPSLLDAASASKRTEWQVGRRDVIDAASMETVQKDLKEARRWRILQRGLGTPPYLHVPTAITKVVGPPVDTQEVVKRIIEYFQAQCFGPYFSLGLSMLGFPGAAFHPNEDLVAGNPSYDKFFRTMDRGLELPADATLGLVYHGTPEANITSILREGLDPSKRKRQKLGQGEYFARNPRACLRYNGMGSKLLVFVVVLPSCRQKGSPDCSTEVINNNEHQIPIGVLNLNVAHDGRCNQQVEQGENHKQIMDMLLEFQDGGFPSHDAFLEQKRKDIDGRLQKKLDLILGLQTQREKKLAEISAQLLVQDQQEFHNSSTTKLGEKLQRLSKLHASRKAIENVTMDQATSEHTESAELLKEYQRKFWPGNLVHDTK